MRVLSIALCLLFFSCTPKHKKLTDQEFIDSFSTATRIHHMADSMVQESMRNAMFDTTGLSTSPIKVISARLFKGEYSSFRSISLTFKNVSDRRIEAIRFKWYGIDAFGEPADMGTSSLVEGFGGGFDDSPIGPGKTRTSSWSILSSRGRKVVLAWPNEIAFSDGSKWEIK
jgi:hypothetical protein